MAQPLYKDWCLCLLLRAGMEVLVTRSLSNQRTTHYTLLLISRCFNEDDTHLCVLVRSEMRRIRLQICGTPSLAFTYLHRCRHRTRPYWYPSPHCIKYVITTQHHHMLHCTHHPFYILSATIAPFISDPLSSLLNLFYSHSPFFSKKK